MIYISARERYLGALTFKNIDRVPLIEWPIRGSTMEAWIKQGYPKGLDPQTYFGLDSPGFHVPINMGMYPSFEEKIIEQNDRYKIWQDNLGAIRKDFAKDDNPGFVTRTWLSFPVKNRADFLEMKKRYISSYKERFADNIETRYKFINASPVVTHLSIPFLFWTTRDWVGFEDLCVMFYDEPKLIEEMFEFITDFCIETLKGKIENMSIDIVEFKEDMAYKLSPMISPQMFRKYMFPHYVRMIQFLKSNGVKVVYVDCDGFPGGLIPEFIEAGVDAMSPVEIAAGNDLILLRKQYPTFGMMGGIDKRELAKDKKAIYNEVMSKVPWLLDKGGYIPHVDHAIPHDVPLENYLYYREILTKVVYGQTI